MATSQVSNSVRVIKIPPHHSFQTSRINAGIVTMRRAPDRLGWRFIALAVRRFRSLSPDARCVIRALAVALCLAFVFIRLLAAIQ
jgi:hypothetical protein